MAKVELALLHGFTFFPFGPLPAMELQRQPPHFLKSEVQAQQGEQVWHTQYTL